MAITAATKATGEDNPPLSPPANSPAPQAAIEDGARLSLDVETDAEPTASKRKSWPFLSPLGRKD